MELFENIRLVDIIEFLGTFAFAISGIRGGAYKTFDWFGAFVLGFVTAVGGGTLRDLLLNETPFWLFNSIYIWCTIFALVFYIFLRKHLNHLNRFFFWTDSIGLGLFVVVGAEKALLLGYAPWVAVAMATITGVIGGIIRDVFLNKIPLIFKKEIYAFSCIIGGNIFVLFHTLNFPLPITGIITAGSVVLLRYCAVKWNLHLPRLKSEDKYPG